MGYVRFGGDLLGFVVHFGPFAIFTSALLCFLAMQFVLLFFSGIIMSVYRCLFSLHKLQITVISFCTVMIE